MKISDIILIILVAVSVMVGIWYLFGNSPTMEQSLLILILVVLFGVSTKLAEVSNRLETLDRSFHYLAQDFKEHIKHN